MIVSQRWHWQWACGDSRQVVDRVAMAEVRVRNQARGHERFERPVHGRAVHARLQSVHRVRDVVGGQVRIGGRQNLEDRHPRVGDPGALCAEFADGS